MIQSRIVRGITRMIRTGRRLVRMAVRQLVLIKIQTTITQAPATKPEATKPEINQPVNNQLVDIAIPASTLSVKPLNEDQLAQLTILQLSFTSTLCPACRCPPAYMIKRLQAEPSRQKREAIFSSYHNSYRLN